MAQLTQDRNTQRFEGDVRELPVAAAQKIFGGAIAALNAAGNVVEGSTALGLVGIGRAEEQVDNSTGSAGDKKIRVRSGVYRFANSAAADEITAAEIGKPCFIVDDQTVAKTSGTGTRSPAGLVHGVDAQGVMVLFDEGLTRAAAAAAAVTLGTPTFVVGAEAGDAITMSIQLKDASGADLAVRAAVHAYFSDDANGDSLAATAFDTVAAGADGVVIEPISNNLMMLVSEADGDIDIAIGENAAVTKYLIIVLPGGRLAPSPAITFA